jgi:hypothetical protein
MSGILDKLTAWFRGAETAVEEEAHGARPVTTSPTGEADRETSTNAQVEGAVGQPWPDEEA